MLEIKHLDREELKRLLIEMELEPMIDSDGLLFYVFPADDDFNHDVIFHFIHDDHGWFGIESVADEYTLSDDIEASALAFCNDYSRRARLPKAFVVNGHFKLEQWIMFPCDTDENYIKQYIELVLTMCWRFFVDTNNILKK